MCTFLFWMVYCGIWERSIVGFVRLVYSVYQIVEPFHSRGTVMQTLLDEQVHQFGELITALIVTELGNQLRDDTKMFTVFAPTDAAFRNAPQGVMNRILGDKDLLQRTYGIILKPESCYDANFIGTDGVGGCDNDILWYHRVVVTKLASWHKTSNRLWSVHAPLCRMHFRHKWSIIRKMLSWLFIAVHKNHDVLHELK